MSRNILFLCPHNAAKSVIASSLFQKLSDERGLDIKSTSAGTEPSPEVPLSVINLLKIENIDVSEHKPRAVTINDLSRAWRVITFGLSLGELSKYVTSQIECWDDVPPANQDPIASKNAIMKHMERLLSQIES